MIVSNSFLNNQYSQFSEVEKEPLLTTDVDSPPDVDSPFPEEKSMASNELTAEKIQSAAIFSFKFLQEKGLLQKIASYLDLPEVNALMRVEQDLAEILNDDIFWETFGKNFINLYEETLKNKEDVKEFIKAIKERTRQCFFESYSFNFFKLLTICTELKPLLEKINIEDINSLQLYCEQFCTRNMFKHLRFENATHEIEELDSIEKLQEYYKFVIKWCTNNPTEIPDDIIRNNPGNSSFRCLPLLPISFFRCAPSLKELRVKSDVINFLPDNIANILPNLEILDLAGNDLPDKELPKIMKFKNLKELNLACNELRNPPEEFWKFIETIEKVDLTSNLMMIPMRVWFKQNIVTGNNDLYLNYFFKIVASAIPVWFVFNRVGHLLVDTAEQKHEFINSIGILFGIYLIYQVTHIRGHKKF
jgi:hypothetical protein